MEELAFQEGGTEVNHHISKELPGHDMMKRRKHIVWWALYTGDQRKPL